MENVKKKMKSYFCYFQLNIIKIEFSIQFQLANTLEDIFPFLF